MQGKKFLLKEIINEDNLLRCFSIRYQAYYCKKYIVQNVQELDIDGWDFKSTFLGAYDDTELIGTIRIVHNSLNQDLLHSAQKLKQITKQKELKIEVKNLNFPLMQAFNIKIFLDKCHQQKKQVTELSRLAFIGNKKQKINVINFLVISMFFACSKDYDEAIVAIHPKYYRVYKKLGFEIIPGTKEVIYPGINNKAIAMHCDLHKFNKANHLRLLDMRNSI